eukprot:1924326-Prymnesium_polylepis.1
MQLHTNTVCLLFKRKCVRCDAAELNAQLAASLARQAAEHPMKWPAEIIDKIQYDVRTSVQAKHGVKIKERMGWKEVHAEMQLEPLEYGSYHCPHLYDYGAQVAFAYDRATCRVFDPSNWADLTSVGLTHLDDFASFQAGHPIYLNLW